MTHMECSVESCEKRARSLGLCPMHRYRLAQYGDVNTVAWIVGDDEARFLSKIRRDESGCHLWTGSINRYGYGEFRMRTINKAAHRYAWERAHGPIEGDMTVDHICCVRHCVNLEHLRLMTLADNVRRGRNRARAEATHCGYGHEWTDENTYEYRGQRQCRACNKRRNSARRRDSTSAARNPSEGLGTGDHLRL